MAQERHRSRTWQPIELCNKQRRLFRPMSVTYSSSEQSVSIATEGINLSVTMTLSRIGE